MRAKLVTAVAVLLLATSLAFGGGPLNGDMPPQARFNGSHVVLQWWSQDETGVSYYEVARSAGNGGQVFRIADVAVRGNNQAYEFIDQTALRTNDSFYVYEIRAVYADGTRSEPYQAKVLVSISSVRRTWGSIKAMFR